ncbi:histidine phosphotransferase family protein [Kiloniella laminariae]|uniref:histidine phosphotransferase family protein n=1 Tax=Kiloniella laminariae TaxID=454162 RepID=UPI000365B048|nr:histidine phosphotransferase family protein [Kiloniella laminariae]
MSDQVDFRVLELLTSRLCHDLVGPVGAVNNGLELMEDDSFGMAADALKLATGSAVQAAATLQFYRIAYGLAGSRLGSDFATLNQLASNYLKHTKAEFNWPNLTVPEGLPEDGGKILLNLIAFGLEMLPRGGVITAHSGEADNRTFVAVTVAGESVAIREEVRYAISEKVDPGELTPRNVHAYFTRFLAQRRGSDLLVNSSVDGHVQLIVSF